MGRWRTTDVPGARANAAEQRGPGCSQLGDWVLQVRGLRPWVSEPQSPVSIKRGGGINRGEDREALQSLERKAEDQIQF